MKSWYFCLEFLQDVTAYVCDILIITESDKKILSLPLQNPSNNRNIS